MKGMVTVMNAKKIIIMGMSLIAAMLLYGGCSADSPSETSVETSSETSSAADSSEAPETERSDGRYSEAIFENVIVESDVVYTEKKDYSDNDIKLSLDVYQPDCDTQEKRPVIIWVHGGGMYTGSKNESWEPVCVLASDFAKKGYVCISIDYRLNPTWEQTNAFNETMRNAAEDVAESVDFVRKNAEKYRIDTDKIILGGYSSGAEIVDNYYFSNYLTDEKIFDKSGIKAVISISGNRLFFDSAACSGSDDAKCLILHGESDDINPLSDAQKFLSQLGERGVMKTLAGNGHFWLETEEQKSFLTDNITEFLVDEVIK